LNLRTVYVLQAPPPGWMGERGFIVIAMSFLFALLRTQG
jgi:hypothetical protein